MLTTEGEMDEDVQQILVEGLLPGHLKLLTVEKLLRWSLLLQDFGICIKHVHGVDKVIADMLSRP